VHEHKDMIYTSEYYAVETLGVTEDEVIFSAPKLFFAYGIGNSFSFPLYTGRTAILLEDRPTAENTLDMIERFKPTVYFGVPTLYAAQVALMEKGRKIDMGQIRLCLSGGEPLPPAVMENWKRLTGVDVLDGIGSSEGLHIYAQNLSGHTKAGSAGRPVPGYRLRVIDSEQNSCRTGSRENWSCKARASPSSIGTSQRRPRIPGPKTAGSVPATQCIATRTAISSSAAAATTC
jgi:acyl-coenzyme A synthetase/AMP-(fatty) acid ligase